MNMKKTLVVKELLEKYCRSINDEIIDDGIWSGPIMVVKKGNGKGVELEKMHTPTSNPILYRWLVKEEALGKMNTLQDAYQKTHSTDIDLSVRFSQCKVERGNETYYALYFGKSKDGTSRITHRHLGSAMRTSTLRRSLCGLFVPNNVSDKEVEVDRLLEGSYFEWLELASTDKEYLVCLEAICIALGKYPLNIDGNPFLAEHPDWEKLLKESRKELKK